MVLRKFVTIDMGCLRNDRDVVVRMCARLNSKESVDSRDATGSAFAAHNPVAWFDRMMSHESSGSSGTALTCKITCCVGQFDARMQ